MADAGERGGGLPPYDAVVLAGGEARRLGGVDKPSLEVGGRSMLDRVLDAVPDAETVVVVGPERVTARPVTWTREEPPGGGPVAALVAALPQVTSAVVVTLAGDLPFVRSGDVEALRRELAADPDVDGAVYVDAEGHDQLLLAAWRADALREAAAAYPDPTGVALRRLVGPLAVRRCVAPEGARPAWLDCDTPEDLRRAEELA